MIHYTVNFEQQNAHLFEIRLNLNFAVNHGQRFYLPNWIPGSYMIRDFSRNITSLCANSKGEPVALEKTDKSSWQLLQDVECLEINYQVYAWDLSVRSAHLDSEHAFFNGTSLFLGIDGYEAEDHTVILNASSVARENQWMVATAMPRLNVDAQGFGKYRSGCYEELIDHPFEVGNLTELNFEVAGIEHQMVFCEAPDRVDWERIRSDVQKICAVQVEFFGDQQPPFERYVFMTFVQKKGFGGLEHRASTALHCSFGDLPQKGENTDKISPEYRGFLSLCCHEYFHSWNVKRIKPARFIPMNLSKEINTELLWFFEGITSYYDELLLARSGVIAPDEYLDLLAQTVTKVMRSRGRFKQSVAESSFDAWTKFYKQDENAVNSLVSYYTKGALVALCLDFEIRRHSEGRQSLDDLMRIVWRQFGKTGKGLGETQVKQIVKEMLGTSLSDFFAKALYSTEELPLQSVFDGLGVSYQLLPQYLQSEKGGFVSAQKQRKTLSFLGLSHSADPLGAKVTSVVEGSCAAEAGLSQGDIIIALDNVRVVSSELDEYIGKIPPMTKVQISFFRRERLFHRNCQLSESEANTCYLSLKEEVATENLLHWLQPDKEVRKVS